MNYRRRYLGTAHEKGPLDVISAAISHTSFLFFPPAYDVCYFMRKCCFDDAL